MREDTSGSLVYQNGQLGAIRFVKNTDGTYAKNVTLRATISKNVDGTYALTYDNGMVISFNSSKRIVSSKDTNNNITTFAYIGDTLTTITDANGRVYTFSYTPEGRVQSVTDFAGNSANFTYFGSGATLGNQFDVQKITLHNGISTKDISFEYTL